jgi:NAD(P)H-dependent flavin oxidoreductase YrpB (nitropropane dioxygenase family)
VHSVRDRLCGATDRARQLTGGPILVVGAGAVYDGRGLAANLMWGAVGVWVSDTLLDACESPTERRQVGTRFVASVEAGAPKTHKEAVLSAGFEDAVVSGI